MLPVVLTLSFLLIVCLVYLVLHVMFQLCKIGTAPDYFEKNLKPRKCACSMMLVRCCVPHDCCKKLVKLEVDKSCLFQGLYILADVEMQGQS